MRIDALRVAPLRIPRRERFTIARGSSDVAEIVFVSVRSGDFVGHGCAAPSEVTQEDAHSVSVALQSLTRGLAKFEFETPHDVADRMDTILAGQPSAKAAIDIAVHDLVARDAEVPLFEYLGGSRDRMPTDRTIGIMETEEAVERAVRWVRDGFRSLKVKVGTDPEGDFRRLRAIREAVGADIELRVDGNQGYPWREALSFARDVHALGIAFFEQPVSAMDWEGMRALAESSPIPIMADEMVLTAEDVKKLRWSGVAHAVNLKLMKHGGICRSMDVNTICESAGYPAMVGCMGEPQLSIAAGLQFALAHGAEGTLFYDQGADSFVRPGAEPGALSMRL